MLFIQIRRSSLNMKIKSYQNYNNYKKIINKMIMKEQLLLSSNQFSQQTLCKEKSNIMKAMEKFRDLRTKTICRPKDQKYRISVQGTTLNKQPLPNSVSRDSLRTSQYTTRKPTMRPMSSAATIRRPITLTPDASINRQRRFMQNQTEEQACFQRLCALLKIAPVVC